MTIFGRLIFLGVHPIQDPMLARRIEDRETKRKGHERCRARASKRKPVPISRVAEIKRGMAARCGFQSRRRSNGCRLRNGTSAFRRSGKRLFSALGADQRSARVCRLSPDPAALLTAGLPSSWVPSVPPPPFPSPAAPPGCVRAAPRPARSRGLRGGPARLRWAPARRGMPWPGSPASARQEGVTKSTPPTGHRRSRRLLEKLELSQHCLNELKLRVASP